MRGCEKHPLLKYSFNAHNFATPKKPNSTHKDRAAAAAANLQLINLNDIARAAYTFVTVI